MGFRSLTFLPAGSSACQPWLKAHTPVPLGGGRQRGQTLPIEQTKIPGPETERVVVPSEQEGTVVAVGEIRSEYRR